jgi:hypothetical protein
VAATDGHRQAGQAVVVHASARDTLRLLRPVARIVLEDVALDAVGRDGRLVASTSARLVAEHVGIDAGTAASALRLLRKRGFLELEQQTGEDGRFGLAGYVVHLPVGLELMAAPCGDQPRTATPRAVDLDAANTPMVTKRRQRAASRSKPIEQGTFDLGLGNR